MSDDAICGPWNLNEYGSPRGTYFITDASGATVASSLRSGEAKARAMAAAPALLEVAQDAIHIIEALGAFFEEAHGGEEDEVHRDMLERLRAAVASAARSASPAPTFG